MRKSDFFDEDIVSFVGGKHHGHHSHYHHIGLGFALNVIYYEWNKSLGKWTKLRDSDPEPEDLPGQLPDGGAYDGQIIEVEL